MKYLTQLAAALAVVTITSTSVVKSPMVTPGDGKLELLILHNNDMHARFEQTSQLSGACTAADREAGKCYGGFPRVAHVVKEARRAAASGEGPPVLYLNAGDTYTGTAWFTIYKWKIAAEFINALQPDAVSLGNNELNAGSSELSPFLENLETNIVATNVIVKGREDKLQKSLVFDIKGVKIGLVGYLALDAKVLDSVGNVEYIDEVIALKEEVTKLQEQNINIIIALGHAGLDKDIEIAREVEGVDLVIAGEKNTFMWNGASAIDQELNEPIEVIQESGKRVPVIRSSAYNTYLGQIYAEFDAFGEITALSVDPIVLDDSVKQDNESVDILNMLHAEFSTRQEEILGQTAVVLDGDSCKYEECNLGNLITDAMVYYHATRFEGEQPWTDASIAIIPADIINASIAPSIRPASITLGDILTVLPVESNIVTVTMNGTILLQVLEHAVSDYDVSSERFLQLSGIRVEYNLENEIGSRVVSAVARCSSCYVPEFYSIDSRSYTVMMPASLANGDYGYSMLVGLPRENLEYDEVTCTAEFIRQRSLVYPEVAGRITILNDLETTETPLPSVTDTPTGTTDPNTETTELDTATTEPNTATTEPDSQTTEPDTDTTEPDTATTEPDSQTTEPDTDTTEPDTATTEPDTDTTEPDTDTTEPDSETTETTEPDSETTEPDSETTEPDTETTEPDSETTEPDSEITEPPVTEAPEPTEPPVTDGPISTPEPDTEPTDPPGTEGPTTTPEPDSAIALSSTLTVLLLTCIPFLMS